MINADIFNCMSTTFHISKSLPSFITLFSLAESKQRVGGQTFVCSSVCLFVYLYNFSMRVFYSDYDICQSKWRRSTVAVLTISISVLYSATCLVTRDPIHYAFLNRFLVPKRLRPNHTRKKFLNLKTKFEFPFF